jgi:hypothetical protein
LADPSIAFVPGLLLGGCLLGLAVLGALQLNAQTLGDNYRPSRILKMAYLATAATAFLIITLTLILTSGSNIPAGYAVSRGIIIGISFVLVITCWFQLLGISELRHHERAKSTKAINLDQVMNFRSLMGNAGKALGNTYIPVLLFTFGLVVLARVVLVLAFSAWQSSLLLEEQSIITWVIQNNYGAGATLDPSIAARAQTLYYMQNIFVYLQDTIKSVFYFISIGIGMALINKAIRGQDARLSSILKETRRHVGPLILISCLFSAFYQLGLYFFFVPGLLFYVYCIFAFPNLLVVEKYKTLQNFGESKNHVKGNFARVAIFSTLIYFMQFGFQLLMQPVSNTFVAGIGGMAGVQEWRLDPATNIVNLLLVEVVTGAIMVFIAPIEASIIVMLFNDIGARKRAKVAEAMKSSTAEGRTQSLKNVPLADRVQKAIYCTRCGLSVRPGARRCPNCKSDVP